MSRADIDGVVTTLGADPVAPAPAVDVVRALCPASQAVMHVFPTIAADATVGGTAADVLEEEAGAPAREIAAEEREKALAARVRGVDAGGLDDRRREVDVHDQVRDRPPLEPTPSRRTTKGARSEASQGLLFPIRRCSPQRKPLSEV